MKFDYKKYLPYAAAIVVFAIATLIYFKPLLSGKELRQDDIARHKGMSKEIMDFREKNGTEPLWTNSMFGGMPAYQISTLYPGNWLGALDEFFKLYLPHPGNYLFLYCLGFFILLLCFEVNPWLALVGGLAYGLSSYFLIIIEAGHNSKANALGYLPAMIGGIVLLFRGRYWLGLAVTALFTALELNANHVQITYYGYILIAFIIAGYFFIGIKEKKIKSWLIAVGLFFAATGVGLLPNAAGLMSTNEYGKYSTRGKTELTVKSNVKKDIPLEEQNTEKELVATDPLKEKFEKNTTSGLDADYATQWSYGIGETFTFLIPDFKGGASRAIMEADPNALKKVNPDLRRAIGMNSSYFGNQPFTSGPVYIGAIVVFLAFLGMFIIKNRIKWALFFGTLLTVALGWGSNFMSLTEFFMHYVPGYNKFRAVSMIMIVAEITLPLLAIMCVNELLKLKSWDEKIKIALVGKEVTVRKMTMASAIVVGGFCLLCYLMPDMFTSFTASNEEFKLINRYMNAGYPENEATSVVTEMIPHLEVARKAIFKSDAIRSFIFIALAFAALYLFWTNRINRNLFLGSLGLFIVIDLWTVDTRYLNAKSFVPKGQNKMSIAEKSAADEEILKDPDPNYRVLSLNADRWNDALTSYYHKSIGGYHGAKLKKYQELIDFHLDHEIDYFYKHARAAFNNDSSRNALLGELDVINMLNAKYFILPTGENGEEIPLENPQANGNAWFVKNLVIVPTADDEILGLRKIKTKTQAITTEKFKSETNVKESYEGEGSIKLLSYQPNHLVYESDTKTDEFAVFSEIYYPKGWNAYVDGEPKPHISVNYVLRGMPVPAGKHKIEFKFEPKTYQTMNTVAMVGSMLLFITLGVGVYLHRKRSQQVAV